MISKIKRLEDFHSASKDEILQRLRSLISVIEYRLDGVNKLVLKNVLDEAKKVFGVVPRLNDEVSLPDNYIFYGLS
jgi:hypothetical protein